MDYKVIPVADAIAQLAANPPEKKEFSQALIDFLQAEYLEPLRQPDGSLAFRKTPAGHEALRRIWGEPSA